MISPPRSLDKGPDRNALPIPLGSGEKKVLWFRHWVLGTAYPVPQLHRPRQDDPKGLRSHSLQTRWNFHETSIPNQAGRPRGLACSGRGLLSGVAGARRPLYPTVSGPVMAGLSPSRDSVFTKWFVLKGAAGASAGPSVRASELRGAQAQSFSKSRPARRCRWRDHGA